MNHFLLFIACFIILSSCEKVIPLDTRQSTPRLVVEGLITNEDTSYFIKISRTSSYNFHYNASNIQFETGAMVIVSDNIGTIDTLLEVSPGNYKTSLIKGTIGNAYRLEILTSDGQHYRSDPEEMLATPPIDSIYFERDYNDHGMNNDVHKFYSFIDWKDPANEENYYLRTFTYYWNDAWHDNIEWKWVTSDKYFDGLNMKKYSVGQGYGGTNWYIKMDQYSLTKRAYDFWLIVQEQTTNTNKDLTNISAPLIGNIQNVNDPDDYVLGYFQISAKVSESLYINK